MARLRDEEWLAHAKRVHVGSTNRVQHGRESRKNLVVGNDADRWWAWCQSCKAGAVVKKEHALLVQREVKGSRDLTLPNDMRSIDALHGYEVDTVFGLLARKGMDRMYLPADLRWSESRHRLMVPTDRPGEWMGRDTSEKSMQKWLTYHGQHYVVVRPASRFSVAVLTEDLFSAHKVAWAAEHQSLPVGVYCTLGTVMHDALLAHLMCAGVAVVSSFYDGDDAGHKGCVRNALRLRALGMQDPAQPDDQCAPWELDPKDMRVSAIQLHLTHLLRRSDDRRLPDSPRPAG
ncbi:DNA primase [Ralstonia phage phiAp1]|uniref:DNA primase n=1 Tax=Ralstonia phage phiAp1 TaxID=2783867 RepID=A0A1L7DS32_9CAUD|nr:DNA primase [Ralstonia phage phiAp1]APU03159.1 DNA primase [Ralstonia phage phiAp1]